MKFKMELGFNVLEKPFRFVDNKTHVPTITIFLAPCEADDMLAWDDRDRIAESVRERLSFLPEPD